MITKEELRKEWIKALRSGEYGQTEGRLRRGDSFCCLGVLCELAVKHGVVESYSHNASFPPVEVQGFIGLRSSCGEFCRKHRGDSYRTSLTHENDHNGAWFHQIADLIEEHSDQIFV